MARPRRSRPRAGVRGSLSLPRRRACAGWGSFTHACAPVATKASEPCRPCKAMPCHSKMAMPCVRVRWFSVVRGFGWHCCRRGSARTQPPCVYCRSTVAAQGLLVGGCLADGFHSARPVSEEPGGLPGISSRVEIRVASERRNGIEAA